MLTEDALRNWLTARYHWRVWDRRIRDIGYAFLVNRQSDAYLVSGDVEEMLIGIGDLVVLKASGAVWTFAVHPDFFPLYEADDEETFYRLKSELLPESQPDEYVPMT